ncbi:hypothetical protein [Streptomyces sp. NPDC004685]
MPRGRGRVGGDPAQPALPQATLDELLGWPPRCRDHRKLGRLRATSAQEKQIVALFARAAEHLPPSDREKWVLFFREARSDTSGR